MMVSHVIFTTDTLERYNFEFWRHSISLVILFVGSIIIKLLRPLRGQNNPWLPEYYTFPTSRLRVASLIGFAFFLVINLWLVLKKRDYAVRKIFIPLTFLKLLSAGLMGSVILGFVTNYALAPEIHSRYVPIPMMRHEISLLAAALKVYRSEYDAYPPYVVGGETSSFHVAEQWHEVFEHLPTFEMKEDTPVFRLAGDYIKGYGVDMFSERKAPFAYYPVYDDTTSPPIAGWMIWSPGPDGDYDFDYNKASTLYNPVADQQSEDFISLRYDPTNGMRSPGDYVLLYGEEY
jgi:hypothetical protein